MIPGAESLHTRFALRLTSGRWLARYRQRRIQGFGVRDAARLASGRPCDREKVYDVPFWLLGYRIATVRVPGANAYGAEQFAERYLAANLYPHQTAASAAALPRGGREIILAEGSLLRRHQGLPPAEAREPEGTAP